MAACPRVCHALRKVVLLLICKVTSFKGWLAKVMVFTGVFVSSMGGWVSGMSFIGPLVAVYGYSTVCKYQ